MWRFKELDPPPFNKKSTKVNFKVLTAVRLRFSFVWDVASRLETFPVVSTDLRMFWSTWPRRDKTVRSSETLRATHAVTRLHTQQDLNVDGLNQWPAYLCFIYWQGRTLDDRTQEHSVFSIEYRLSLSSSQLLKKKKISVALVRKRTIPTERPPPVGEVSANFCG